MTRPIGRPSKTTTAAPCARLWISAVASDTESSGASITGVSSDQVAALDEVAPSAAPRSIGRSCGRTTMPPRRATVSAIRRPATAVMLATTTGMVVPEPSTVDRSTSNRDATSERFGHDEDVVVGQVVGGPVPSRNFIASRLAPYPQLSHAPACRPS